MYTDDDLDTAVAEGIFSSGAVTAFRQHMAHHQGMRQPQHSVQQAHSSTVDEENFRLIGGFNDIFVVIACVILCYSSAWMISSVSEMLAPMVLAVMAWGLSELFVRRRKMALPAIVLLLIFVWGVLGAATKVMGQQQASSMMIATAITALATALHWWRFKVPITVAAGMVAVIGFLFFAILSTFPESRNWASGLAFLGGLIVFATAMWWDMSDRQRLTRRSDVAFWLHLLAAPLIVHPVFYGLGVLQGNDSLLSLVVIVLLYVLMTLVSLVIDRRAFMVSSLVYVLYAVSTLFETYGGVGFNLALTGIVIGAALILLSGFWHSARQRLLSLLPSELRQRIPA